jgi:hypothetical protein
MCEQFKNDYDRDNQDNNHKSILKSTLITIAKLDIPDDEVIRILSTIIGLYATPSNPSIQFEGR